MCKKFIDLILENALNIESRKKYAYDREGFKLKDQYLVDLKLINKNGFINRTDIIELYSNPNIKEELKLFFALNWGGINKSNYAKVVKLKREVLRHKIFLINKSVDSPHFLSQYLNKFNDMHITGIGVSFITKHMYFLNKDKYFIYDKWTKRAHLAMLLSDDSCDTECFFKLKGSCTINDDIALNIKNIDSAYKDFCERVIIVQNEINSRLSDCLKFITPGHLESFLFGEGYHSKDLNNPRVWTNNYINLKLSDINDGKNKN